VHASTRVTPVAVEQLAKSVQEQFRQLQHNGQDVEFCSVLTGPYQRVPTSKWHVRADIYVCMTAGLKLLVRRQRPAVGWPAAVLAAVPGMGSEAVRPVGGLVPHTQAGSKTAGQEVHTTGESG
jgi:hypothetical protein